MNDHRIYAWWACWVLPFIGLFLILLLSSPMLYLQLIVQLFPTPDQTSLQSIFALYAPCGGLADRQFLAQLTFFIYQKRRI